MGFWAWSCICLRVCLCVLCEYPNAVSVLGFVGLCIDVSGASVYIYVPVTSLFPLCSKFPISYLGVGMAFLQDEREGFSLWALLTLGQISHHSGASLRSAGVGGGCWEPPAPVLPPQRSAARSQQRAPEGRGRRRGAAGGGEPTWAALRASCPPSTPHPGRSPSPAWGGGWGAPSAPGCRACLLPAVTVHYIKLNRPLY